MTCRVEAPLIGEVVRYVRDAAGDIVEQHADGAVTAFGYDAAGRVLRARNADAEIVIERNANGRVRTETCNGLPACSATTAWAGGSIGTRRPAEPAGGSTTALGGQRHCMSPATRSGIATTGPPVRSAASWVQPYCSLRPGTRTPDCGPRRSAPTQARGHAVRRTYTYRLDDYLTGIADPLHGDRALDIDPSGQVTTITGAQWSERCAYDPAGNTLDAAWPAPVPTCRESQGEREYAGALLRRAGNVHYRYDRQGRTVERRHRTVPGQVRSWRYEWNAEDVLTAVTTPNGQRWVYRYDPFGRRIAKQRLPMMTRLQTRPRLLGRHRAGRAGARRRGHDVAGSRTRSSRSRRPFHAGRWTRLRSGWTSNSTRSSPT
jgi:YD repeat-containing protein